MFSSQVWTAASSKDETTLTAGKCTLKVCADSIHPRRGCFVLNWGETQGFHHNYNSRANSVTYYVFAFPWQGVQDLLGHISEILSHLVKFKQGHKQQFGCEEQTIVKFGNFSQILQPQRTNKEMHWIECSYEVNLIRKQREANSKLNCNFRNSCLIAKRYPQYT